MALASTPRTPRNDLLPDLALVSVPIDKLQLPKNQIRKLQEGHVKEVANIISTLGFSVPVLIGKKNVVLDGAARASAVPELPLPIAVLHWRTTLHVPSSEFRSASAQWKRQFAGFLPA